MSESTITVHGSGVAPVRPDGVRLSLTVRSVASTPAAALDEAARRSHDLEAILGELGVDPSAWTTTLVSVQEERRWDESRQQEVRTGYAPEGPEEIAPQSGGLEIGPPFRSASSFPKPDPAGAAPG